MLARIWYDLETGCRTSASLEVVLSRARILIVEDDPVSGRTLAAILRYFGHSVEHVTSVTSGLERLAAERPQVVLLDLMLPDGDGALILARLRASRINLPVAIITSIIEPDRLEPLRRLGAQRVFAKPVDPHAVLEWIDDVTANSTDVGLRSSDDLPGQHLL